MRRLWLSIGLAAAVSLLAGSIALAVGQIRTPRLTNSAMMNGSSSGWGVSGPGMMGGPAMMGTVWLAGDGHRVTSIAGARDRAAAAAATLGVHVGEVIWFDNGFYVELKDAAGNPATEVIVDPATGTVGTEPGPAMMWNTRYGMHRAGSDTTSAPAVNAARAQQIATDWLNRNLPGRLAQPADAYPGYYTLETSTGEGTVNGMLSVNAVSGAVWYHSWHGRFIAKEDS